MHVIGIIQLIYANHFNVVWQQLTVHAHILINKSIMIFKFKFVNGTLLMQLV